MYSKKFRIFRKFRGIEESSLIDLRKTTYLDDIDIERILSSLISEKVP